MPVLSFKTKETPLRTQTLTPSEFLRQCKLLEEIIDVMIEEAKYDGPVC